jgi:hypothetical protein
MALDEQEKARVDRELIELLNEIRVALPGIQVLFAFLLILPFQSGFDSIDAVDRAVLLAALVASAVASILLIAPSIYHRLNFRRKNKERMLFDANGLLVAGTACTGAAMILAVYLVVDVVAGAVVALIATGGIGAALLALWLALPLVRRREPDD